MKLLNKLFKKNKNKKKKENKPTNLLPYSSSKEKYKPIGILQSDITEENIKNKDPIIFKKSKNLSELKKSLYSGISQKIRPSVYRKLLKYMPLKNNNEKKILEQKRKNYKNFTKIYNEEKYISQSDIKIIEMISLIKKDVQRTLPLNYYFRNKLVQNSMVRILFIYSLRHPSNFYTQGLNDILAIFFFIFSSECFKISYSELENEYLDMKKNITEEKLLNIEADCFYCFSDLMSNLKNNYISDFVGIKENFIYVEKYLKILDKNLFYHLKKNDIDIMHFAFKWNFCLLLREFSVKLCIKLMDFYLIEDLEYNDFCVHLMICLLLKFSYDLMKLEKEKVIIFVQNLPTKMWGYKDIEILASEAYALSKYIKRVYENKSN